MTDLVNHPQYKLGVSHRSAWDAKRLTLLAPEMQAVMPSPPSSIAKTRLSLLRSDRYGYMYNDRYGDCTVAAKWHTVQHQSGFEKHKFIQSDENIKAEYFDYTGGQDSGLSLLDVLQPWKAGAHGGHQLAAYAEIPWTDRSLSVAQSRKVLKQGIWLMGSAYIAVELPYALQNSAYDWRNVGTGADWRAGTWGGHCVPILAYESVGGVLTFYIITWGQLVPVSEAFLRAYMVEAWAPVATDWQNAKGTTPNGRSLQALVDLAKLL